MRISANCTRESFIPESYTKVVLSDSKLGLYIVSNEAGDKVIGFSGRRSKPSFHYHYPSASSAKRYIDTWVSGEVRNHEYREQIKAERRKPHTLEEGDILVASWGWEQTNINYYQVVSLSGKTIAVIRELKQVRDYNNATMQGYATPVPGVFKNGSKELRVKVDGSNQVKVDNTRAGIAEFTIENGVKTYRRHMFSNYA